MAISLSTSEFNQARKLIDIQLTAESLPDAILALDVYSKAAIAWVKSRTDNADSNAKFAAIYKLASLVAPAIPDIFKEANAGYSYEKAKLDSAALASRLEAQAAEYIAISEEINPTREDAEDINFFTLARRDRCSLTGVDILDA